MEDILGRERKTGWVRGLVGAIAFTTAAALAVPSGAQAQCVEGAECTFVRPDGKGIIGLGLIGAELGLIIPALAGVRDEWWPYLVFPLIGAVAGGIGGWAIEDATGPNPMGVPPTRGAPEASVTLLAVGMALIVPTIVGTLALTAYSPPETAAESDEDYEPEDLGDDGDSVEAVHDDGAAPAEGSSDEFGATSRRETSSARRHADNSMAARMRGLLAGGPGFVRLRLGEAGGPMVFLAAPLAYSNSSYTAEERAHLLLNASSDFVVPMFSATF